MDFRVEPGNTPLDQTEAEGLIPSIGTQIQLNLAETQNIFSAIMWAETNRRIESDFLNPETLKMLHRKMFDKTWRWAGKFRVTQKSIGIEAFRISTELKNLTENMKTWIEFNTYPPDEIATRFHHRLVQIHAFPNGNGRHARLATDILCNQLGIEAFSWGAKSLINTEEVRKRYITSLQMADGHDYSEILEFVRS